MLLSDLLKEYPDKDREIGDAVSNVSALADLYQRTGKVAIELKLAASGRKTEMSLGYKVTEPAPDPELGLFYRGPNGELSKDDPEPHQFFNARTGEITPAADPTPEA